MSFNFFKYRELNRRLRELDAKIAKAEQISEAIEKRLPVDDADARLQKLDVKLREIEKRLAGTPAPPPRIRYH